MKKIFMYSVLLWAIITLSWCFRNDTVIDTGNEVVNTQWERVENIDIVEQWDLVGINYIWSTDEWVFDTNLPDVAEREGIFNPDRPYEALAFVVWEWRVIPWMESGVVWMSLNETKTFTIPSHDAYGERDEEYLQTYPLAEFIADWIEPALWETYVIWWVLPWVVYAIDEEFVTLDFNSPLAGMDLTFEVTIVDIQKQWMMQ